MDKNSRDELLHLQLWDLEEKEANGLHLSSYPCPCKNCMGGRVLSRETIRKHLRHYKRDPQFQTSILVRVCIPNTCRLTIVTYVNVVTTDSHMCRYVGVEALKDIESILSGLHCGTIVYRELLFSHDCMKYVHL